MLVGILEYAEENNLTKRQLWWIIERNEIGFVKQEGGKHFYEPSDLDPYIKSFKEAKEFDSQSDIARRMKNKLGWSFPKIHTAICLLKGNRGKVYGKKIIYTPEESDYIQEKLIDQLR